MTSEHDFYSGAVFADEDLDYTFVEDPDPLTTEPVRFVAKVVAAAGAVALTGLLTFQVGVLPVGMSTPAVRTMFAETSPQHGLASLTKEMKRRAEFARRLLAPMEHPGAGDPEPDYGFEG